MPETRRRPARERILAAATELFYERGIAATGIDTVVDHAGVARKSLYNNFSSKDDLIAAFIEQRHHQWLDLYHGRLRDAGPTPADRVLAVFDAYADHAEADGQRFRGCGLLNSAAEFPAGSPPRVQVSRHKQEVEDLLRTALEPSPLTVDAVCVTAGHLSFLLEGAMTRSGLDGTTEHLRRARDLAEEIVRRATSDFPGAA
ncbi:MAG: TetR/AcrR family transcriptional regulator [Corynebacterium sp.]|uniref:TetR/AcrR family transcriptional regulator n=1 Tax=unclassified Corynebacterium TaxID=2624378 RepID=UPI00095CDB0D|nr:TetR/AcrR family transcriptional regulator [Corynebacterium sp. CNJ-954]OLT53739.1 TetR family transcriptional regulator [Corynebacterium sp. CNJ-954]